MNDTQELTLTDFLLARIAEDEAAARAAEGPAQTPWRATYGRQVETARDGYLVTPEDEHSYTTDPPDDVALHIARHDPARVLAECEAKRRIVQNAQDPGDDLFVAILALPYADHPDYREEWRPTA